MGLAWFGCLTQKSLRDYAAGRLISLVLVERDRMERGNEMWTSTGMLGPCKSID